MLIRENVLKEMPINNLNGYIFQELSNLPKINLRGDSSDKNFLTNVEKILNILIPTEPNSSNHNDNLKIVWLSPNEWLIQIYAIQDFEEIFSKLTSSLNSHNTAVTNVTENKTVLKLSGKHLYKLLSKFMIINLDKSLANESSVAQTIFIKVPVLIIRNYKETETPSIFMHINRSHAQYITNLLVDGLKNLDF